MGADPDGSKPTQLAGEGVRTNVSGSCAYPRDTDRQDAHATPTHQVTRTGAGLPPPHRVCRRSDIPVLRQDRALPRNDYGAGSGTVPPVRVHASGGHALSWALAF